MIGTFGHWKAGRDDPMQVAVTYSGQFLELCRELDADGYVISYNPRRAKVVDGRFTIEHRPHRWKRGPGPLYHLGQIWYGVRLAVTAARFGADAAVVTDGTHWFALGLMRLFGVRVIPSVHCVLWRHNRPPTDFTGKLVRRLNTRFFGRRASAVLCVSEAIAQQIRPMMNGRATAAPIIPFLPTYRRESFGDGFPAPPPAPPFRVFYAGRIERNKGVFDLLEIAKQLARDGQIDIDFDLCGTGSALEPLREAAAAAGVAERFRCHGHSPQSFMREMYQRCHVVIVPTTSDFVEGFNKVVAEGVLAGRPVITSSVCPALEYVKDAVLEVPPDDAAGYAAGILQLRDDKALYDSKQSASAVTRTQFYDPTFGWQAAVRRAIGKDPAQSH
ncbi:MAG TPA: glycosyltransferase family 4 protein [Tepidisphaeraceae bacterium]|nr:glycosyltransferase family 4 protein [Tepidisphaeraceae bacterium]